MVNNFSQLRPFEALISSFVISLKGFPHLPLVAAPKIFHFLAEMGRAILELFFPLCLAFFRLFKVVPSFIPVLSFLSLMLDQYGFPFLDARLS